MTVTGGPVIPVGLRDGAATRVVARLVLAGACAVLAVLATGCGGNDRSAKAFCNSLRSGSDPMALFAATGGTADQVGAGIERLHELERAAPSPVSDALLQLIEVGQDIQGVLNARAQQNAATTPATLPVSDMGKAEKASTTVVQYASENCAIALDAPTTTAPPPSS